MEKKRNIQNLYGKVIGFLRNPFFRSFANVFSHGGTHFLVLLIVLVTAVYYGFVRKQGNIVPHNIGIKVGWLSYDKYKGAVDSKIDSIMNINIHVKLNSDSIKLATNGQSSNGVIVELDGYEKDVYFPDEQRTEKDSIMVSLFSEPFIKNFTIVKDMAKVDPVIIARGNDKWAARKENFNFENKENYIKEMYTETSEGDTTLIKISGNSNYKYIVSFISDSIGIYDKSPYYYYYISFPLVKFSNEFTIDFAVSDIRTIGKGLYDMEFGNAKNLQYDYIFPEPDVIGNGRIRYFSKEKKKEILKNRGVIIQAVDVDALNKQNRMVFLYSVLIGTGLAFTLDIIIQLIRELRRLQRRKE